MDRQKAKPKIKETQQNTVRKIRVLYAYCGTPSGDNWIIPGVYLEDDPVLCGLADYLVNVIHDAIWEKT